MWELILEEWDKTVLLNSGLDASLFDDAWWSRAYYSMSVDYTQSLNLPAKLWYSAKRDSLFSFDYI